MKKVVDGIEFALAACIAMWICFVVVAACAALVPIRMWIDWEAKKGKS